MKQNGTVKREQNDIYINSAERQFLRQKDTGRIREIHYNVNTDNAMCVPNQYANRESFCFLSLFIDVFFGNFKVDFGVFFRR